MAVFRLERTRDYTVMSNHHLRDKRLSLKAKGLLSQMLSLPDDWDTHCLALRTSIVKAQMPPVLHSTKQTLTVNFSDCKSRSRRFYPVIPEHILVFSGDWGSASTSRKQAFPVAWKYLFFRICIYRCIACYY